MLRCPSRFGAFLASVLLSWQLLRLLAPTEALTVPSTVGVTARRAFLSTHHYHPSAIFPLSALAEAGRGGHDAAAGDEGEDRDDTHDTDDEEEFHTVDPAETTIQFLSGLWQLIAQGNQMTRGVSIGIPTHDTNANTVGGDNDPPSHT